MKLTEARSDLEVQSLAGSPGAVELSVVVPCLDEAGTLSDCIARIQRVLREKRIAGEVIVADNGSTDGSDSVVTCLGARLVRVKEKGYGNAPRGGIAAARGRCVITGDQPRPLPNRCLSSPG